MRRGGRLCHPLNLKCELRQKRTKTGPSNRTSGSTTECKSAERSRPKDKVPMSFPFPSFLFGKKTSDVARELLETTPYRKSASKNASCSAHGVEESSVMMLVSKSVGCQSSRDDDMVQLSRRVVPPRHILSAPVPLSLPATDITLHRLAICPADAQYSEVPSASSSPSSRQQQQLRRRTAAAAAVGEHDSLLHTACLYRAPNALLERLLLLCRPDTVWTRNSQGWIPLHIHITYSTTPCPALIEAGGAKAIRMKWHGGTALHLACRHASTGGALPLLQNLVRLAPDCVTVPTHANVYPVELIFRKLPSSFGGSVGQWESLWILVAAWKDYTGIKEQNTKSTTSALEHQHQHQQQSGHSEQQLYDLIAFAADCCNPHSSVCVVSFYLDQAQPVSISRRVQRLAAKVSTPRVILRLHQEHQDRHRHDNSNIKNSNNVDDPVALRHWLERTDLLPLTPSVRLQVLEALCKSLNDVSGWWSRAQTLDDMFYLLRSAPQSVQEGIKIR
jgi:hypothetical protein